MNWNELAESSGPVTMPFRKPFRAKPSADPALIPRQPEPAAGGDQGLDERQDEDTASQLDPYLEAGGDPDAYPDPDPEALHDVDDGPQRFASSGVKKGMATVALYPSSQAAGHHPAQAAPALPPGGWSELTDAEIMLRVAAGDEAGFSLLVEKYRRQMVHFMFRMVHNQAVAEELAQEVFLRVYRARASYRAEAKFSTWLYRIATNLGVNHARDTRHERNAHAVYLDQPDPETGVTPDVADTTPTVEQDLLRDARLAAIRKHVMALPERQRTAVLMHKYQDMDYKQIGAVLKLSESATKSLLFRAYQTLRERLQEFI